MPQTSQVPRRQPHAEQLRKLQWPGRTLVSSSYRQYRKRDLTEDSLQPEERKKLAPLARCSNFLTEKPTQISSLDSHVPKFFHGISAAAATQTIDVTWSNGFRTLGSVPSRPGKTVNVPTQHFWLLSRPQFSGSGKQIQNPVQCG